jgi:two-component system CheB/CheR fusion protein
MGHMVRQAHAGREAIGIANELRPEVVFLDISMPGMDGFHTCRLMRQCAWADKTLIVAVTGLDDPKDLARSKEAGFDHHVVKPMEFSILRQILRDVEGMGDASSGAV